MEEEGRNSSLAAGITITTLSSRCGAPPTRLQKQAPAALRLDEIMNARNDLESCLTSAACVIPLLSPLVLSSPVPPPPPTCDSPKCVTGGGIGNNNVMQQGRIIAQESDLSVSGWQHPAIAAGGLAEPSTLFALFQTQCSLVQPTPTATR